MKPVAIALFLLVSCLVFTSPSVSATADSVIIVFYEEGCPACEEMEELLKALTYDVPEAVIVRHEIHDPESQQLLIALANAYGIDVPSTVPIVFVEDDVIIGLSRTQEFSLRSILGICLPVGCESPLARLPATQLRIDLPRLALFLAAFFALAWLQLH